VQHIDGRFTGKGGPEIHWQAWLPAGKPRALVVITHGAAEHSGRYVHVGEHLAGADYAAYALDHRGHGLSQGRRALVDRVDHVVDDVLTLVSLAGSRSPDRRFFLLGHSMGSAIAIVFTVRHQERLTGLVLSGTVSVLETASLATRLVARALSALTPWLGVFPIDPSLVSRDPDVVRAYREDPLVFHGKLPARTVNELAAAVSRFSTDVPSIRIPLLVMHGGGDRIVPPAGSTTVHQLAGSRDKTLKIYDGLYHEILNEPEKTRVLDDLVAWLDERSLSARC